MAAGGAAAWGIMYSAGTWRDVCWLLFVCVSVSVISQEISGHARAMACVMTSVGALMPWTGKHMCYVAKGRRGLMVSAGTPTVPCVARDLSPWGRHDMRSCSIHYNVVFLFMLTLCRREKLSVWSCQEWWVAGHLPPPPRLHNGLARGARCSRCSWVLFFRFSSIIVK